MWVLVPVVFFATAWGLAAIVVAASGGFGAGDLRAFAYWSILPALVLPLMVAGLAAISARWHAAVAFFVAGGVAAAFAVAWTQVVAIALGPYIMAFSFPVASCWLAGSTVGMGIGLMGRRRQAERFSPLTLVVPAVLVLAIVGARPKPPPDLLIEPSSLAARQDLFVLLDTLQHSAPTPDPSTYNRVGVRAISAADTEAGPRLRVTFHATSDLKLRREYIARIRASPFVASATEVPAHDD